MELMMAKEEKRNLHFYLIHAPEDRELTSFIAESLRSVGAEVHGRTCWKREYGFDEGETARLQELCRDHLRRMDEFQPMKMKLQLFLSYAHEDLHDVRRFSEELTRLGLNTWMDDKDLALGDDWIDQVFQALVSCSGIILVFSRNCLMSDVVGHEIGFFLERMSRQEGIFLCTVLLDKLGFGDFEKYLRQHTLLIDLYKMTTEDAARLLIEKVVEFYKELFGSSR